MPNETESQGHTLTSELTQETFFHTLRRLLLTILPLVPQPLNTNSCYVVEGSH